MTPVRRQVEQVIQQVNAGCAQAERSKGNHRIADSQHLRPLVRGQYRHEQQQVFQPLMDANRVQVGDGPRPPVAENMRHITEPLRRLFNAAAR